MNKFEYKNLTPFKWFVLENFPFIEADFDALTEWQLFCKIGKEINKIINSQNVVGTQMENVTNAFIELQNYVNNYFDNLDVQDEINNKLNDMVEDGTLQEIIGDYLNSKAIFGYDNVQSMKEATNLINGSFAETLGFYEKNDGGNALYKIRTITNADIIDEKFIIALYDENLVAELIIVNNVYNIKQIGAKGNGTDNDYNFINSAISKMSEGEILYIPSGEYLLNTTITINKNINIKCEGTLVSNNCRPLIILDSLNNINIFINKLKENTEQILNIAENSINNNVGIVLKDCLFIKLNINQIYGFQNACYLFAETGCYYNIISIKEINTCFNGICLISNNNNSSVNANTFKDICYNFHTWQNIEENVPYFITIKSFGNTPYKNNANNFFNMLAEYGVNIEGGCKLLNCNDGENNNFYFERVEIASTSSQNAFVFGDNARSNNCFVKFMTKNVTFNNLNSNKNIVNFDSNFATSNGANNEKVINSQLSFGSGVSLYTGSVFVNYIKRICFINIVLRCISTLNIGDEILSNIPVPIDHIRAYLPYTTGNDADATPQNIANIYISRSTSPGKIVARNTINYGASIPINLCYKF